MNLDLTAPKEIPCLPRPFAFAPALRLGLCRKTVCLALVLIWISALVFVLLSLPGLPAGGGDALMEQIRLEKAAARAGHKTHQN